MSKYAISFTKLIAEYLPPKKRTEKRIDFIFRLSSWLRRVHAEFITLQLKLEAQSKVTSQVIIFEDYLKGIFGHGITVTVNQRDTAVAWIADDSDEDLGVFIAAEKDPDTGIWIDDNEAVIEHNYTVSYPAALNVDQDRLIALLEKYQMPGSVYKLEIT